MKKLIPIITNCIMLLLLPIAVQSCSGEKVSKEDLATAREMGHKRALEFSPAITLDTCRMEAMLIDIREREQRLRATGHTKAADAYKDSCLSLIHISEPTRRP